MNDYEQSHSNSSAPLCEALAVFKKLNQTDTAEPVECIVVGYKHCTPIQNEYKLSNNFQNTNNNSVYTNSMVVSAVTLVAYIVASFLINKLGKKRLFSKFLLAPGLYKTTLTCQLSWCRSSPVALLGFTLGLLIIFSSDEHHHRVERPQSVLLQIDHDDPGAVFAVCGRWQCNDQQFVGHHCWSISYYTKVVKK